MFNTIKSLRKISKENIHPLHSWILLFKGFNLLYQPINIYTAVHMPLKSNLIYILFRNLFHTFQFVPKHNFSKLQNRTSYAYWSGLVQIWDFVSFQLRDIHLSNIKMSRRIFSITKNFIQILRKITAIQIKYHLLLLLSFIFIKLILLNKVE